MRCRFCLLSLAPGTAVVRWATGLFSTEDPDIFVEDEVPGSQQGEAHLDCFVAQLSDGNLSE